MSRRVVLHLDVNSYFASVEQQANPFLRGKPVAVAAQLAPYGCIIASSREAKAKGIVTGMRVEEARRIDPKVVVREVDPPKYRSTSERIFALLASYSEDLETYSIDEAFLNVTDVVATPEDAVPLAEEIQQRIRDEVGEWLGCSVGVAPTRWLAKFAGDTAAKGTVKCITHTNLAETVDPHELTDAWGIAHRMAARFRRIGMENLGDIRRSSPGRLMRFLGIPGIEWWSNLNGVELGKIESLPQPKSVGHSHVLRQRTADERFHRAVLLKLCERTGRRLRQLNLRTHGFYLSFSATAGGGGGAVHFPRSVADTRTLFAAAERILCRARGLVVVSLAVGTYDLEPETGQGTLWPEVKPREDLSDALDSVNDRFGEHTVYWGTLLGLPDQHAPDRIGFRKTVSWDVPTTVTPQIPALALVLTDA
jgi:DNA polymerase-4